MQADNISNKGNFPTPTGLEVFIKSPAELGLSISTISDMFIPSLATEDELKLFSLLAVDDKATNGSDANAGGGPRDSVSGDETR